VFVRPSRRRRTERGFGAHLLTAGLDAYLRAGDTAIARPLRRISPTTGPGYTASRAKRRLDLLAGVPVAMLALPLLAVLAGLNAVLHPRQPPLFVQDRVGHGGRSERVTKLRSLRLPGRHVPHRHSTPFGLFLRWYHLDELPQLMNVLGGRLSLVGIRILPRSVYEDLRRVWSPARFERWSRAYEETPLGLTGIHQVFRTERKDDPKRFHRDLFYARQATLGLDLYLLWRTLLTIGRRRD
jgi:lipopolysaccharide/colanic/teichoic acid biosynthesis glycosyltransferase